MYKIRSPPFRKTNKNYEMEEWTLKNDYKRNFFLVKRDSKTNEYKYYLRPMGKTVEVDKEVFNVCYNSYKKQYRDNKKDYEAGLVSLDEVVQNHAYIDMIPDNKSSILIANEKLLSILDEINQLDSNDKELITNLLIREKTERELAKQLNVSQNAINKRKNNILNKLRKKLTE